MPDQDIEVSLTLQEIQALVKMPFTRANLEKINTLLVYSDERDQLIAELDITDTLDEYAKKIFNDISIDAEWRINIAKRLGFNVCRKSIKESGLSLDHPSIKSCINWVKNIIEYQSDSSYIIGVKIECAAWLASLLQRRHENYEEIEKYASLAKKLLLEFKPYGCIDTVTTMYEINSTLIDASPKEDKTTQKLIEAIKKDIAFFKDNLEQEDSKPVKIRFDVLMKEITFNEKNNHKKPYPQPYFNAAYKKYQENKLDSHSAITLKKHADWLQYTNKNQKHIKVKDLRNIAKNYFEDSFAIAIEDYLEGERSIELLDTFSMLIQYFSTHPEQAKKIKEMAEECAKNLALDSSHPTEIEWHVERTLMHQYMRLAKWYKEKGDLENAVHTLLEAHDSANHYCVASGLYELLDELKETVKKIRPSYYDTEMTPLIIALTPRNSSIIELSDEDECKEVDKPKIFSSLFAENVRKPSESASLLNPLIIN